MLNRLNRSSELDSQTRHKLFSQILQFRNTCSRRSRLSPAAKTFVVSASFFVVATFLMTPSYGMQIRQATDNRAEEEWLKSSEREVRTLDKIISNLYGRENPFNLLTKRGGGVGAAKHSSASNAAAANKLEKRFAKHLNQLAKDGAEIGLLRSNDECQITSSGVRTFVCPQRNSDGSVECISAERLCNGDPDCPGGDDEDEKLCLFHRPMIAKLSQLTEGILWFRKDTLERVQQLIHSAVPKAHFVAPNSHEEILTKSDQHYPSSSGLTHSSLPIKDVLDIGDGSGDTQIDSKVDQDSRYGGVQFPDGSIMRFANIDNNVDDVIGSSRGSGPGTGSRRRRRRMTRQKTDEEAAKLRQL